jgi:uncharacterized protein YbjT (DUF2867 family)
MITVTGATGKVGSKVADILLSRKQQVRVIGRDAGRLARFTARGGEAAIGDLEDPQFVVKAYGDAEAVFTMIPPNFQTEDLRAYQKVIAENTTEAFRKTGVRFVVNLSSLGAQLSEGTGPIAGLHDMEERLNGLAGVNVLHLRPAYFMENLLMNIGLIRASGIMGSAIRGDLKMPMIATKDIASAAADHLAKRDFSGKTVQDLLGERDISMGEIAHIFGPKIGQPDLTYVQFSYEETEKALVARGLSEDVARLFVEMSKAMNDGVTSEGLRRTPENTTPTSIEEFSGLFAELYAGASKAA